MKSVMKIFLVICMIVGAAALGFAQEGPYAVLEYYDDEFGVTIITEDGEEFTGYDVFPGMELGEFTTITTDETTTVELQLVPNGSIIKLAEETTLIIEGFQDLEGEGSNDFQLPLGQIRTIAASFLGQDSKYSIQTQTAVCGVRGTDFNLHTSDGITVFEGLVDFVNTATNEIVQVAGGQAVDATQAVFSAVDVPEDVLAAAKEALGFKKLDPEIVPSKDKGSVAEAAAEEETEETTEEETTEEETTEEETTEEVAEETTEEETTETTEAVPGPDVDTTETTTTDTTVAEETPEEEPVIDIASDNPFMVWLRDIANIEIGTLVIGNTTYNRLIAAPEFRSDEFSIGLYLPIIYDTDLMDPSTWYRPKGNDEWSFGLDQNMSDPLAVVFDAVSDLALKIKYIELGKQGFSDFYLKAGNLSTMTIGHGSIMRNYANDNEFPAIRKVGLNFGLGLGPFKMEAVTDDLADINIVGGRMALQFIENSLALGLTGIVDLYPAKELNSTQVAALGDPALIGAGVDLELLKIDLGGAFRLLAYADGAAMVPFLRQDVAGVTTEYGGFVTSAVLNPGGALPIKNFGITGGFLGNVLMIDYRLEYQYFDGIFKPAFFNSMYDRVKSNVVSDVMKYVKGEATDVYTKPISGIYGEAGFNLFDEKVVLEAGYMLPLPMEAVTSGEGDPWLNDMLHVEFTIHPGLIPFADMAGSFKFDRTKFLRTFVQEAGQDYGLTFFDENTAMKGELEFAVAEIMRLVAIINSTVMRDDDGKVLYDENGKPQTSITFGMETRIGF